MTNYYILSAGKSMGPYNGIVKARAAAIRAIKENRPSLNASPYVSTVLISTKREFPTVLKGMGWKYPQVYRSKDGAFYWDAHRDGAPRADPVVNADGTLRRRS